MSQDSDENAGSPEPAYRVYRSGSRAGAGARSGGASRAGGGGRSAGDAAPATSASRARSGPAGRAAGAPPRPAADDRGPYTRYRSRPRSLIARLRGETDSEILERELADARAGIGAKRPLAPGPWWRRLTWRRALVYVVSALVGWVVLSAVLFLISAQTHAGDIPAGAASQLTSAGPILTSPNTVLILGLDNRPTTGIGSKEGGGANTNEADANTDTIMLWRIGGGVSRRLSIPRDTLVDIPGLGYAKINAAWSQPNGPALALKLIKQLTGLQINHLIVVDLANFPRFIDAIGGVTVTTPKICSNISGGVADGGFTLDLSPGSHHLSGEQALILARTRDNSCNRAYNDLEREAMQQQILNGIKSQLLSVHAFTHLPWAAWDAPGVIQTDMGGLTLMQLFIASEIGGSAPPSLLTETPETSPSLGDILVPNQANVNAQVEKLLHG